MNVLRIVTNIETDQPDKAAAFYKDIFGLDLLMDQGWIQTYGNDSKQPLQLSFASQGGSNTKTPSISIEVDDLEVALGRIRAAAIDVEYGPVSEPWGVRRFYVRDPFGKLINVMEHS